MPVYNAALRRINPKETARYAGLKNSGDFPAELVAAACLEAQCLASPRGIWQVYDYSCASGEIHSCQPVTLEGQHIRRHLAGCVSVAILAATIGPGVEERAAALFGKGEYTSGLLLDAAGSAAVEEVADSLERLIVNNGAQQGYGATPRFSPGYGDWAISIQPEMLRLAHAGEIGVNITASLMLTPRKSITAVIGLYPTIPAAASPQRQPRNCQNCPHRRCIARKEPEQ
ncbi:MAG: methionine synthase [Negativicutes bacterium]|nr:methionine synthase [Negativicutes bacterium]